MKQTWKALAGACKATRPSFITNGLMVRVWQGPRQGPAHWRDGSHHIYNDRTVHRHGWMRVRHRHWKGTPAFHEIAPDYTRKARLRARNKALAGACKPTRPSSMDSGWMDRVVRVRQGTRQGLPHCRYHRPSTVDGWLECSKARDRACPLVRPSSIRSGWMVRVARVWQGTRQGLLTVDYRPWTIDVWLDCGKAHDMACPSGVTIVHRQWMDG